MKEIKRCKICYCKINNNKNLCNECFKKYVQNKDNKKNNFVVVVESEKYEKKGYCKYNYEMCINNNNYKFFKTFDEAYKYFKNYKLDYDIEDSYNRNLYLDHIGLYEVNEDEDDILENSEELLERGLNIDDVLNEL